MAVNKEGGRGGTGGEGGRRKKKISESASEHTFPVIGIGASAGGLEAFTKFLSSLPTDTGMAFVLIQHLDPTHTSNMVGLLRRQTKMEVFLAEDGMKLQPDCIYMMPPNKNMLITDRTLMLEESQERPGISHNIDRFFLSLAQDLKEKSIAIIMSGTGSDGSAGAKAIKAELGMVMVQDPATATYDGMPRSAIAAGVADYVLPAEKMAQALIDYVKESYGKRRARRQQIQRDTSTLNKILTIVRSKTRHDFSSYKETTINRRIERRMGLNQIDDVNMYLKYLREHSEEVDLLAKDFLINVTSFFRDPAAFDALKVAAVDMMKEKPEGSIIRAWVPGCSTGEEAYSVAIVLEEAQEYVKRPYRLQVFGSDLDEDAVALARRGVYPVSIIPDVAVGRLERFFDQENENFQVKRELRDKLVFAVQDITQDPPFTRMDVVSARNLLIYFKSELQRKILPTFNYALNKGGLLFLGTAETIGDYSDGFAVIDQKWKIFRKKARQPGPVLPFSTHPAWREPPEARERGAHIHQVGEVGQTMEKAMLDALPPSVLLDQEYKVIFAHGDTGKYVQLPQGKPQLGILEMVSEELKPKLASALQEAVSQGKQVIREGNRVKANGGTVEFRTIVKPVDPRASGADALLVVTFQEVPRPRRRKRAGDSRVAELEQELQSTKETLRSTIEELETANEELRSANEEYQSSNEELQSTNEELETSREELQSINEELTTVNAEHQKTIEQLSVVYDDMKNLLDNTGTALVFLDEDLKLQRFTPMAKKIFNFIDSDVGRSILDVTHKLVSESIAQQARQVLETLVPISDKVVTTQGHWYSVHIHPYRTNANAIAGVGISFIDISEQEGIRECRSNYQSILDTLRHPVLVLDNKQAVEFANMAFYRFFDTRPEDTEGYKLSDLGNGQWDIPEIRKLLDEVVTSRSMFQGYKVKRRFPKIGRREIMLDSRRLQDPRKDHQRILLVMEDVTGREGEEAFSEKKGQKVSRKRRSRR